MQFITVFLDSDIEIGGEIIVGRIPRTIIYKKEIGNKRALFYLFLYFRTSRANEISIGVNESILSCGYKPNSRQGKINDEFNVFCKTLVDMGYIEVSYKEKQVRLYNALAQMNEQKPFALVRHSEFIKIIENRSNHATALLLLSFVRLNSHKKRNMRDKQPEIYFCHMSEISERLGISTRCITSSLKTLTDINILYGEELPRYQDEYRNWHSGVYIFVDMVKYNQDKPDQRYNWKEELNNGIKWIKKQQMDYLKVSIESIK